MWNKYKICSDQRASLLQVQGFLMRCNKQLFRGWLKFDDAKQRFWGCVWLLDRDRSSFIDLLQSHFEHAFLIRKSASRESPEKLIKEFFLASCKRQEIKPGKSLIHIGAIDQYGTLHGWALSHLTEHANIELFVDEMRVGDTVACTFRKDLLEAGLDDGDYGFTFQFSSQLLDGEVRDVTLVMDCGVRLTRQLQFPKAYDEDPHVRSVDGLTSAAKLRTLVVKKSVAKCAADILEIWDKDAATVFLDFGIKERFRRSNSYLLGFRERLIRRFSSTRCPSLIRDFNRKEFTNAFCQSREIRVPNCLLISSDMDEVSSFEFPKSFVLKPTSGSGECIYLISEGYNLVTKERFYKEGMIDKIKEHKKKNPPAAFLVEELVEQAGSVTPIIPLDYKLHVFSGKVRLIQVIDRNVFASPHSEQGWFSSNWQSAPFGFKSLAAENCDFSPPRNLAEMIAIASRIGSEVGDYLRIDLYDAEDGVVLGEITTFSGGGIGFSEYGECILTQLWHLPIVAGNESRAFDWTFEKPSDLFI